MISNKVSVTNNGNAVSPLIGSFHVSHSYYHQSSPYQTIQQNDGSLAPSSYGSIENYGPSMFHPEQQSVSAGPYSSLSSPPSHYYANQSIINSNYKIPTPGAYSHPHHQERNYLTQPLVNNSLYRPNGASYHHYPPHPHHQIYRHEAYIPEYITNRTYDPSKNSVYGHIESEHASFSDHLKLLQESFQSKSLNCFTAENSNYPYWNLRCTDDHRSSFINVSEERNCTVKQTNNICERELSMNNELSNHNRSSNQQVNSYQKSISDFQVWNPHVNHTKISSTISNQNFDGENCQKNDRKNKLAVKKKLNSTISSSLPDNIAENIDQSSASQKNKIERNIKQSLNGSNKKVSKQKEKSKEKVKKNKECQNHIRLENSKKNVSSSMKLFNNSNSQSENNDDSKDASSSQNSDALDVFLDGSSKTKLSKKNNNIARRRRFRSGLDMIRSSRKKPSIKLKSSVKRKNETVIKQFQKECRTESKRLMVNKSLGETLLHRSARNNRLNIAKDCIESEGCDVNARDNAGYTPLHECASRGNLEVARLLLQHYADCNASAIGGIRPIHDAIENNHIEMVRLLVSYGADPNISTYSGSTPLQLCRSKAMQKLLEGLYKDITTNRLDCIEDTFLWEFKNDLLENGFDVLSTCATLETLEDNLENDKIVFEASSESLVSMYTLHKSNSRCFYLLEDVLHALSMRKENFVEKYPDVKISLLNKSEWMNAINVQLEKKGIRKTISNKNDEIQIIFTNNQINQILSIETTVIF